MNITEIANNAERFTQEINSMCKIHKMRYLDAITLFCEENEMDIQDVVSLIGSTMIEQLRLEAEKVRMVSIDQNKSKLF